MYSYVCVCHILSKCINLQTRIAEHTCVRIMTHTFPVCTPFLQKTASCQKRTWQSVVIVT